MILSKKVKQLWHQTHFFFLALGCGIVLSLPFWSYYFGWLSFIVLIPFLLYLNLLQKAKLRLKSQVGYIWVVGWVMMLGVTFWILQTEPGRWTGLTGWLSIILLLTTYLLFSGILAIGFILFGIVWAKLKIRFDQKRIFLVMPALWVVCEWLRGWIFSIISIGPDSMVGPHWNFGNLGFAASVTPLVFIGRFVGLLGISFVVVVINLCILWIVQKRWKLPSIIILAIIFTALCGWLVYKTPNGANISVLGLQLGTNQNLEIGSINYHDKLNAINLPDKVDLIVLPEYSEIFNDSTRQEDISSFNRVVRNSNVPIVTSRQTADGAKSYNTVTIYNSNASIIYEYNKSFLIPVGEAMPYAFSVPLKLIKQDDTVKIREVTKGASHAAPYIANDMKIGSQACSGAITPELYRQLVSSGAQVLTNSASLSIFATAQSYHQQAQQMARFMAVANARPFVQSTDGSYSFIINSNGVWQKKSQQKIIEYIYDTIKLNSVTTLYTILGEWVFWFSLAVLFAQSMAILKKK